MLNINIKNLQNEVEVREQRKYNTFDKVLDSCYAKILSTNQKSNDCCCLFTCPPVIFGVPLYNVTECVKYVMEKLAHKGFKLYFTHPNSIFISWKNEVSDVKSTDTDKAADYYKKRKEQTKLLDKFQQKQLLYEPQPNMYQLEEEQGQSRTQVHNPNITRDQYLFKNSLVNNDLLLPRPNPQDSHISHMNNYSNQTNRNRNSDRNSDRNTKIDKKQQKDFRPISDYHENKIFEYKNSGLNGFNGSGGNEGNGSNGGSGYNVGNIDDINLDLFD